MAWPTLSGLFGRSSAAPASSSLETQIVSVLANEITGKESLATSSKVSDQDVESLRMLNTELALLELITDTDPSHVMSRLIRDAISAEGDDLASSFSGLRELEEPEVRYFLGLAARMEISPEFRKEAVSALLEQANDDEKDFLRTLFRDCAVEEVRQAAIYAFDPAETPELREQLIADFKSFTPRLRLSTIEILSPYRTEADVKEFVRTGDLTADEKKLL